MNVSDKGLKALELREGKRNAAYYDTKGIVTIGVGHVGGYEMGDVISDEEVRYLLKKDLAIVEKCLDQNVLVPLTQYQYDALVSFIFNVGTNAFKRSTMLKYINLRNFAKAAKEFDRWHIPPEITSRRNGERDQFMGL